MQKKRARLEPAKYLLLTPSTVILLLAFFIPILYLLPCVSIMASPVAA